MKIRIHRFCALTLISVWGLVAFTAAQQDLPGQPFDHLSRSSQLRPKTEKTRKANAANKPAHYTYEVLYNFCSEANCADGEQVSSDLIRDEEDNLYGVTWEGNANPLLPGGTVFELDTAGNYTVLHSFCQSNCTDGIGPNSLVMDSAGNIYGTAVSGGAPSGSGGVVFELTPPAQPGGAWTETVLYSFCLQPNCTDGAGPNGLVIDSAGNIYGTTQSGGNSGLVPDVSYGTVFELSPPSQPEGAWTETVLHRFCSASLPCDDGATPNGGLMQDAAGNLYGTTMYGPVLNTNPLIPYSATPGTVFRLARPAEPGDSWTETVLYDFCSAVNCTDGQNPNAGVIMDSAGNLYGTSLWNVFELTPPAQSGGVWTENVLQNFFCSPNCPDGQAPNGGVIIDTAGNLYGVTSGGGSAGGGTVFELTSPPQPGGTWSETLLYNFCSLANCADGASPHAGLLRDPAGNLYGGTWSGGSHGGGTVFTLAVPSFTMAATSVSLNPGATTGNTSTITLNPHGSFTGSVKLTAAITSKPANAQELPTLSFASNPVSITGASAVKVSLTITTTAPTSAALEHSARPGIRWYAGGMTLAFGLMFGIGICFPTRGRIRRKRLGSLLFLVMLGLGLLSCGGGTGSGNSGNSSPGTTPGAYVVTVTGTSGSITATGIVTLTVE